MSTSRHAVRASMPPSSLEEQLVERIRAHGPITVADYMQACLADPEHGYYRVRDAIGGDGDFITAPEVSQMFGELIGLWCLDVWRAMGAAKPLLLVELGPGRGTLMADALRAARVLPAFLDAVAVRLVETSPVLRARQAETLAGGGIAPCWHDALSDAPAGPTIVIGNEFLDALPVRQLVRRRDGWAERMVDVDAAGRFVFRLSDAVADPGLLPQDVRAHAAEGDVAEVRPAVEPLVAELARRARERPLAALFIDYGHAASAVGDTLQAVRGHRFAEPLDSPGEADLTAHVDFADLARTARGHGLHAWGPVSQRAFLLGLGLEQRRQRLAQANPDKAHALGLDAGRLVNADQMGELFKAMALTGPGLPAPPAF